MATVLIADDDAAMRDALVEAVRDLGHDTRLAVSGEQALEILDREPVGAVILDLRMPGMGGLEALRRMRGRSRPPAVTVLTAHATATNTIEAMRLGAFDHLTKPIGRDDLRRVLHGMLASSAMPRPLRSDAEPGGLIGSSEAMRTVAKMIGMLADSDATVLISGETGTGKELAARAIHEHGHRREHPFIAINCAAIPVELIESELFGHMRGAFTGAVNNRRGGFQQAEGGTLFLDEIGDMGSGVQSKILRVIEDRVVAPLGGRPASVDVRVIAATHRDLQQRVRDGEFREDLFYRLNVVPIHLPPLRERIADIVPLAQHFLRSSGKRLSADAASRLVRHAWPGNVRELRNAMERCALLARSELITLSDLAFLDGARPGDSPFDWPDEDLPTATARLEAMLIRRALAKSGGNRAEAARQLNIHRQHLYAKMKRHGIAVSEERTDSVREPDAEPPQERLQP
jgi:two-component system NtrC family response regulator